MPTKIMTNIHLNTLIKKEQKKIHAELSKQEKIQITISLFYAWDKQIIIKASNNAGGSLGVFFPNNENQILDYFNSSNHELFNQQCDYVVQKK